MAENLPHNTYNPKMSPLFAFKSYHVEHASCIDEVTDLVTDFTQNGDSPMNAVTYIRIDVLFLLGNNTKIHVFSLKKLIFNYFCIYAYCNFIFIEFVTLQIKLAWNYILLRIDVESRFNSAI